MDFFTFALYIAASLAISYLMAPKPPGNKPGSLQDFSLPTADESRNIPVIFGKVWVTGPMLVWYGALSWKKIKKRSGFKKVTVGYKYYMGLQFVISYCADSITRIRVGKKNAYTTPISSGAVYINKSEMFGGESQEGGIEGTLVVHDGNAAQVADSWVDARVAFVPSMRGLLSAVWRGGYIGTSKYPKAWSFEVKRTDILTDGTTQWYPATANIGDDDLNPAHIIRECYTDDAWGMGVPASLIDDANFTALADTLYAEGFGLSMQWVREETIEAFVGRVLQTIDGIPTHDETTGKLQIKLIRDDYDPGTIPHYTDDDIVQIESFERKTWGETVNKITVSYKDNNGKDVPVTVHDLGNINIQQSVVPQTNEYPGLRSADLASRIAQRDLRNQSLPLARITVILTRAAYSHRRGDVIKLTNTKYKLDGVVVRIMAIEPASLIDGTVKAQVVEDAFALPTNSYMTEETNGWTEPDNTPAAITAQRAWEKSYVEIKQEVEQGIIDGYGDPYGFAALFAKAPLDLSAEYLLQTREYSEAYADRDIYPYTPNASLGTAISKGNAPVVVSFTDEDAIDDVEVGTMAIINNEAFTIDAIDLPGLQLTLARGTADTIPGEHSIGDIIWFPNGGIYEGEEEIERPGTGTYYLRGLTITADQQLDAVSATEATLVMSQRAKRPYPPAGVTINGSAFPAAETGDLSFAWAHRDRLAQGATQYDQADGSVGPEAGTTYTIRIIDPTGPTTMHTESAIAGASWTYTQAARQADFGGVGPHDITIEIESERDGLVSRYTQSISLTVSDI